MTIEKLFLLNSLWIFGLYMLFENEPDSKGLLWKVNELSTDLLGLHYSKPVCLCPPCMASVHSLYFYFGYLYINGMITLEYAIGWIPYAVMLVGFNYLVTKLINR